MICLAQGYTWSSAKMQATKAMLAVHEDNFHYRNNRLGLGRNPRIGFLDECDGAGKSTIISSYISCCNQLELSSNDLNGSREFKASILNPKIIHIRCMHFLDPCIESIERIDSRVWKEILKTISNNSLLSGNISKLKNFQTAQICSRNGRLGDG